MGFTKRARAAENAIRGYPSRFPSSRSLSKATRERRGRARPSDCCVSPLTHFPHHCFYFPFNFFQSIFPLHLSCSELSPLLSPLQRLPSPAVSISLPRAQRQFSRSSPEPFSSLFFIPFFSLSDFPSHICGSYWYSQIQPAYRGNMIRFRWVNGRG